VRLDGHHLEIVDSGIGIPEDRFPALFKRLDKGKESTGFGLGLSIVSRVAERLGWTVDIQSRSGAGTRVSITFLDTSQR
jgi:signal transduction histidine kinase